MLILNFCTYLVADKEQTIPNYCLRTTLITHTYTDTGHMHITETHTQTHPLTVYVKIISVSIKLFYYVVF